MAAEQISQDVIRMMAPDSVFLRAINEVLPQILYITVPAKLTSGEVGGTRFRQPSDPAWRETHRAAIRSVQVRSYMTHKAWAEQFKIPVAV
jgi:hypothetical protein